MTVTLERKYPLLSSLFSPRMCFIDRSLEQVTAVCSLCKAFPPRNGYPYVTLLYITFAYRAHPRLVPHSCPHKDAMGVCKNRTNHPRHDVLYFRNAELSSFNGCGFCKVCHSFISTETRLMATLLSVGKTQPQALDWRCRLEEPRIARLLSSTQTPGVRLYCPN